MNILAVDDEPLSLRGLVQALEAALPGCSVAAFGRGEAALHALPGTAFDLAVLDIELGSMSGLALAARIKEQQPACLILFLTAYSEYAVDAFRMHAAGYLLKPLREDDIRRELEYLLAPPAPHEAPQDTLQVQTFGNFEVFRDGEPLRFRYAKTKELLAYLVDRRGAECTIGALLGILWEDKPASLSLRSQLRNLTTDLAATLRDAGAEDVLVRRRGVLAVRPDRLDCDYYRWLAGDIQAVNSYRGEYMSNFSWADFTNAALLGTLR